VCALPVSTCFRQVISKGPLLQRSFFWPYGHRTPRMASSSQRMRLSSPLVHFLPTEAGDFAKLSGSDGEMDDPASAYIHGPWKHIHSMTKNGAW
jgi:hypothetical protein